MAKRYHEAKGDVPDWEQVMYDNWVYLKDPVRERWSRLTDLYLDDIDGHHERLVDHIQVAYGIHREQAEAEVNAFMDDYHDDLRLFFERMPGRPSAPRAQQ